MPGNPIASYAPPSIVADGVTQVIDCSTASYFTWVLGANRVISTFLNPVGGQIMHLELVQDATGSRTVTWPSNVSWAGGTAPTLTTTAGGVDLINMTWNPTAAKWRARVSGQAYA